MRTLEPEVTEGARSTILRQVAECPGIHLRSIERETSLPLGQVLYHLDRLERMGLVASHRDSGFRRYFAPDAISRTEKPILSALRHDVPRRLVLALLERPGLPHKVLQQGAGVAGSTLSFHLQRLAEAGVLERRREGLVVRYHLTQPEAAIHALVYWRESFQDPEVDRFVRETLSRLIPGEDDASRTVPIGI